ncbi:MAG: carbamoyl-phosphate synthase domain-containing protein [Actinomycetaceae bacterium]|nr:carbamoyl-phosphate synthase domain-containing protein [Actinomycetaceae bacterium]
MTTTDALLVFANGTIMRGVSWGAKGVTTGNVVVDTSISGYEAALRNGENKGKLVLATSPHIGNVGARGTQPYVAGGFIVRDPAHIVSNWTAEGALEPQLSTHKVVGISGIDTRAVVRLLNSNPGLKAGIFSGIALPETVRSLEQASEIPVSIQTELVNRVVESE